MSFGWGSDARVIGWEDGALQRIPAQDGTQVDVDLYRRRLSL
jgi:hypothetical protein